MDLEAYKTIMAAVSRIFDKTGALTSLVLEAEKSIPLRLTFLPQVLKIKKKKTFVLF